MILLKIICQQTSSHMDSTVNNRYKIYDSEQKTEVNEQEEKRRR